MDIMNEEKPKSTVDEIIEKAKTSEAAGGASFMDPQPKQTKRARGRPKGSTTTESGAAKSDKTESKSESKKGPVIETKVFCYPIVKVMSIGAVSYTKDPRAACTPTEAENIAETMGVLFDKHLPDLLQNYGAEAGFILAMGQWTMRLVAIKKLQSEEMRKKAPQNPAGEARPTEGVSQSFDRDVTPML